METDKADVSLISVYVVPGSAEILWNLLAERDPAANISHKQMPTMAQHQAFVRSRPYSEWHFIRTRDAEHPVAGIVHGACYLSRQNEIGIQIFKAHQGKGIGRRAVELLIEMHKGKRLVANVNPMNERSARLFRSFGFRLVQYSYELEG